MRVLGLIVARGGSKGLPSKNLEKLLDKTVLDYTIKDILQSKLLTRIALSSDDEKILAIGSSYSELELIKRPAEFATDTAPLELAMRHAVEYFEDKGEHFDAMALFYGSTPIKTTEIIDKAVQKMIDTDCDCVLSVSEVGKYNPLWLLRIDEDTDKIDYYEQNPIYRRQDLPRIYRHDGAVAVVKTEILKQGRDRSTGIYGIFGDDIRAVYQNDSWDVVDIDHYYDLKLAEIILKDRESKGK